MTTATVKTQEEIDALKRSWASDPCWDIEDSEGFEAHRDELLAFKAEQEAWWEAQRRSRLENLAKEIGKPGDLESAELYEAMKTNAAHFKEKATTLLIHYLRQIAPHWDSDNAAEIHELADALVESSVCEVMARHIKQPKGNANDR